MRRVLGCAFDLVSDLVAAVTFVLKAGAMLLWVLLFLWAAAYNVVHHDWNMVVVCLVFASFMFWRER